MDSPSPSAASADPSSLRAAALLTLKAKRRKPAIEQPSSFSRPIPPSDSFQLDYGQGDTPDYPMDDSKPLNITPNPPPVSLAQPFDPETKDLQMREEGEISEEEGAPLPSPAPKPSPTRGKSSNSPSPAYPKNVDVNLPTSPRRTQSAEEIPRLPLADRTSKISPISRTPYDNQTGSSKPLQQGVQGVDNTPLVSAGQVRPGLPLTQSEYDTAKDIVLDILGWGVPPEYLVDCGLTREIIYYVFTELKLRLPKNLDIAGLVPYTPDAVLALRRPTLMPPPPLPEGIRHSLSGSSLASSSTLTDPRQKGPTPPLAILSPPSLTGSPPSGDLHDMERQRRQELMARKAVQASRKLKQLASADRTTVFPTGVPSINQDVEMISTVPTETVDDFLNSIGHVQSNGGTPGPTSQPVEEVEMDVDDIPGLGVAHQDGPRTQAHDVSKSLPKSPMESEATHPPSSSDSVSTFDSRLTMSDASPSGASTPDIHAFQRRGAKRPVAADFVDFDSVPRGNGSGSGYEHANGYPLTRRRTGGANFTNLRSVKCVIDLSDSEGEEAGEHVHRGRTKRSRPSLAASPGPLRPPGNMSPAVLKEKELEIRKMRELIAQREQSRLKKLAQISRSISHPDTNDSLAPIKQEEDDSTITSVLLQIGEGSANNASSHSSHSTTPQESDELTLSSNVGVHASPTKSSNDDDADDVCNDVQALTSPRSIPAKRDLEPEAQELEVVSQSSILEFRQESQMDESVDVDPESSSSAQVQDPKLALQKPDANLDLLVKSEPVEERHEQFPAYVSPFELCPLLRVRSRPMISAYQSRLQSVSTSHFSSPITPSPFDPSEYLTSSSSYTSPTYFPLPTLKPLKLATASKVLDPTKQICQYEVPGGGTCRDEECEDLHLSKLMATGGVEPSDQDTAEFLCSVLPDSWLTKYKVSPSKVTVALQQAHFKTSRVTFEERVAQALITLGPPPPPPPR